MSGAEKDFSFLKNRPVAIFGLARSGLSFVKALHDKIDIIAWDDDPERRQAISAMAQIEPLTPETLSRCACLILSPGVPLHYPSPHPVVDAARKAGTEIICDLEFFHRLNPSVKTLGITGTNGKSTTTALLAHTLQSFGLNASMAGNIGIPVFDIDIENIDRLILEISSYQLDLCPKFRPDIAILLNLTPDHLDRHGSLENYTASKMRILQGAATCIIGIDDQHGDSLPHSDNTYRISVGTSVEKGAYITGDILFDCMEPSVQKIGPVDGMPALKGLHNQQNMLAAYVAARLCGMQPLAIIKAFSSFPGLAHRQYPVKTRGGVTYINDSKATNAEAASKALASYENIFWIAGGRAKQGGLGGLEKNMGHVHHVFLIGEAAPDFADWLKKQNIAYTLCRVLDRAVEEGSAMARNFSQETGNPSTLLLSPACASWDQYESYEARGDHFISLVNRQTGE